MSRPACLRRLHGNTMNTSLTPAHPDDMQLIQRHLAGDREAFRLIVERYQGMVCAVAYSAVGDVATSEDVAQEVFVAAWKQLPQLREPAKLRGWLCGITRNLAQNSRRRAHRTPTAWADELPAELPEAGGGPRERAMGADEAGLMWEALRALPDLYREPMVMFYREGHTVAAVAAALEISEDTARQRLARGRAQLTGRMARLVEETLTRTAPTPAFTGFVLLALPGPLTPALLEVAGRESAATNLAPASALAGAVAKGGVAAKVIAMVAFLPALMNGAEEFLRFRMRNDAVPDESERRRVAWAYLIQQLSFGFVMLAVFVAPILFKDFGLWVKHPWFGVAILFGMVVCLWAQLWIRRRIPDVSTLAPSATAATGSTFEYRTVQTLLGWPLAHVRLGGRRAWHGQPAVKAWVALSDGRAVGLLFATGVMAVAPVSLGVLSAGVLSIGALTVGIWALGAGAVGWLVQGVVAAGGYAAKGIFVAAGTFASGWVGTADHVNDAAAKAFISGQGFYQFSGFAVQAFACAAGIGWLMPVALTGWQLWQTRRSQT